MTPKTTLEYKIRFQNKGTASTVFVTVRDTLSADQDVASFERGAESHSGAAVTTYKYNEKYILQWQFPSLVLTPSTVNDAASSLPLQPGSKPSPWLCECFDQRRGLSG